MNQLLNPDDWQIHHKEASNQKNNPTNFFPIFQFSEI